MKIKLLITAFTLISSLISSPVLRAQNEVDEPDTIYYIELDTFDVTARSLHNYNYSRYESIVAKVYPLADSAVMILNQLNSMTDEMDKKKDQKKYKKELEDDLRERFEKTLKNLTKSQGEVLIDLIERKTGQSLYDILKDVKSGSTAFWWQNLGKMYGYDLKDGYHPENNPTLEQIIVAYEEKHKSS